MSTVINYLVLIIFVVHFVLLCCEDFYGKSIYKNMNGETKGYNLKSFLKRLSSVNERPVNQEQRIDRLFLLDRVMFSLGVAGLVLFSVSLMLKAAA